MKIKRHRERSLRRNPTPPTGFPSSSSFRYFWKNRTEERVRGTFAPVSFPPLFLSDELSFWRHHAVTQANKLTIGHLKDNRRDDEVKSMTQTCGSRIAPLPGFLSPRCCGALSGLPMVSLAPSPVTPSESRNMRSLTPIFIAAYNRGKCPTRTSLIGRYFALRILSKGITC